MIKGKQQKEPEFLVISQRLQNTQVHTQVSVASMPLTYIDCWRQISIDCTNGPEIKFV